MEYAKRISKKYCPRFGMIAIEMGYITEQQLIEALGYQAFDEFRSGGHRLLGAILFDKGWMKSDQIDRVATELLRRMRLEPPKRASGRKLLPPELLLKPAF